jgi:hypothetical protein
MDGQVPKPKTEIVQKQFDEFRDLLKESQTHLPKFEQNVNLVCELRDKILEIEKRVSILEKEHKGQLKASLKTIEENARPVLESIFEEKIAEIKNKISSLEKMIGAYSGLPDIAVQLTERFTQHNTDINILQTQLTSNTETLQQTLNKAIEEINITIKRLDTKYSTVIIGQNAHNTTLAEQLKKLQKESTQSQPEQIDSLQKQDDQKGLIKNLSTQKSEEIGSKFKEELVSLQRQITFLKRIVGLSLTLFAGWYLWLQVQSGEFNNYFSR